MPIRPTGFAASLALLVLRPGPEVARLRAPMKLTFKLTSLLVVGNCLVLAGYGLLAHDREERLFARGLERDTRLAGATLIGSVDEVWRAHGAEAAKRLVEQAGARQRELGYRYLSPEQLADAALPATVLEAVEAEGVAHHRAAEWIRTYVRHVPPNGDPAGVLEVAKRSARGDAYVRRSTHRLLGMTAVSIAVSGLIAFLVGAHLIGRPVEHLVRRVEAVAGGNLSSRLDAQRSDELGTLADALDQMAEDLKRAKERAEEEAAKRQATLDQLRHAERLATVGRLGAGLAHELGTPLNVVLARAKLIERRSDGDDTVRDAGIIGEQTRKMTRIIRQLLDFARRDPSEKERVELWSLCEGVQELLRPIARKRGVQLVPCPPEREAWIHADPGQFEQVVTNVLMNAIQASPQGGSVELRLESERTAPRHDPSRPSEHWLLCVRDEGPGIPREARERIFEPFYTTKDVGEGTGLGLTVVHGIVAEHDGWIEVESEPGEGARFTIHVPALAGRPAQPAEAV